MRVTRKWVNAFAVLMLSCFGSSSYANGNLVEQGLVRAYFGMAAIASSQDFVCLNKEQKYNLDEQLKRIREQSMEVDASIQLIVNQGVRLTQQYAESISCTVMQDYANRLQLISEEADTDYAEYMEFSFGRELLLGMIKNASIDAEMMVNFAYGSEDVLSGDTNELLYQLSRDQVEFSLAILNDYDIGIDTKSFYTYLLKQSEKLESSVDSDDQTFKAVRASVSPIYRKMGMVLLSLDAKDADADFIEALVDFANDTRQHLNAINMIVIDSLPAAI